MASIKEIKTHIESVRDTRKITNAMYLIASTKLRRAKAELDATRPYFNALRGEIKRIFRTAGKVLLADHPNTKLFVVGEYGRRYFEAHGIPVEHSFLYTAQNPTMQRAREIAAILLDLYDRGQVEKIYVVYTDMKNGLVAEPKQTRLLPFHRAQFFSDTAERAVSVPFEFTPSVGAVLDNVIASYVSGFIYSALVDSFCCEQNARMRAMDSANRNAEKILADLTTAYNRVRQSAITQEITEVSAGAKAQRLAAHTRETKEADADAYR